MNTDKRLSNKGVRRPRDNGTRRPHLRERPPGRPGLAAPSSYALVFVELFEELGIRRGRHLVAARLVVEGTPIALAHVGLVAAHFVVLGDALRPKLHARVGPLAVAEELELDLQLEVAVGLRRAKELVARDGRLERAADDGPVLDTPSLLGVAVPAGEGLAVEEGR